MRQRVDGAANETIGQEAESWRKNTVWQTSVMKLRIGYYRLSTHPFLNLSWSRDADVWAGWMHITAACRQHPPTGLQRQPPAQLIITPWLNTRLYFAVNILQLTRYHCILSIFIWTVGWYEMKNVSTGYCADYKMWKVINQLPEWYIRRWRSY